jgi:hypothetical protein
VRRGPKGVDDGGAAELTEGGGDDGATVAVRLVGVDTRPRKERRGDRVLGRALAREDEKGKKRGGGGGDGSPFKSDAAGSEGRATGGATRWRGVGGAWGQRAEIEEGRG